MKKFTVLLMVLCLVSVTLEARKKEINLMGSLGLAASLFDNLSMDLGVELEVSENFFFQFVANTHFGESDDYPYYYPGVYPPAFNATYRRGGLDLGLGGKLYGLNAYGLYKAPVSSRFALFGKAGFISCFTRRRIILIPRVRFSRNRGIRKAWGRRLARESNTK